MKGLRYIASRVSRLAAVAVITVMVGFAAQSNLDRAGELYKRTEYEAALRILSSLPNKDAAAYLLIGQCHYMQGDPKKATDAFQKAVELAPGQSDAYLWLGRGYGRRAETSSFVTAPGYANKARENFEKAVQLNPGNLDAISDLFEYYLEAPGFLGGGFDKAQALAKRMEQLNPAEGHWALARLAEKRKEFGAAEQQLRRAVDLAPRQVGRMIDLAKFLSKNGRYQESDETFVRAESIAPDSPKLMFERARTYIQSRRHLDMAKELLQRYLKAELTADDPPRKEAQDLLKRVSSS